MDSLSPKGDDIYKDVHEFVAHLSIIGESRLIDSENFKIVSKIFEHVDGFWKQSFGPSGCLFSNLNILRQKAIELMVK